ncbi:hypothetical protein AmDm5_0865 [Acetobacter malorum]|nr:hypothetical protein AmDm5_0865 [Acetobacter malorum]
MCLIFIIFSFSLTISLSLSLSLSLLCVCLYQKWLLGVLAALASALDLLVGHASF